MELVEDVAVFTVNEGKKLFVNLLQKFNDEKDSAAFLQWIHITWPPAKEQEGPGVNFDYSENSKISEVARTQSKLAETIMKDIAAELRQKLPLEGILPSEKISAPTTGENNDCLPECTVHIDSFLYEDDAVDALVEDGILSRNYCKECGSKKTEPLVFISHSASRLRLCYIFTALLPPLDGVTLLDVGSRLGPILYAAALYSNAEKIIGVEMNKELCQIQEDVIQRHDFQGRVQVVEDDVMNQPNLVHSADVVILHNVFEFFLTKTQQESVWRFLRESIKSGTILVTSPPLPTSLMHLKTGIDLDAWVIELPPHNTRLAAQPLWSEDAMEVTMYRVL